MECEMPMVTAPGSDIETMFDKTRTIAVVGCSPKEEKDSNMVAKYLLEAGYDMIPLYPKGERILGQKVYRKLADIEKSIDMVVVFRKPAAVSEVVKACKQRGDVKYLWTQMGIVNNEAAREAVDAGMEVVQNRCSMVDHQKLQRKMRA
ncbi:MAG: CoA-binding protein [Campylobacterota bacterium]